MPFWLIPAGLAAAGVYFFGKSEGSSPPDPIASLTNLLIVGGVLYIGYKVVKK